MLSPSMFRDAIRKLSLRQKLVILASVGVLLPIGVLTYMQYRSLTELQNNTKGAFKDNLRQGLTLLELKIKQRLDDIATQTLNPIGGIDLSSAEQIEKYFANIKRTHAEIEAIFLYSGDQQKSNAYLYSDKFVKVAQAGFTPAQSDIQFHFDKARVAQN